MKLTKENSIVSQSEKGNLYISHPDFKTHLRFYASIEELQSNADWRNRVAIREGNDNSFFAVLAKTPLTVLDV